jgi:hypothetical protein
MPGKVNSRKLTPDQMNSLIMWDNQIPQWADKLPTRSQKAWEFMIRMMSNKNVIALIQNDPEFKNVPQYELDEFMKKLSYTRYVFRNTGLEPGDSF